VRSQIAAEKRVQETGQLYKAEYRMHAGRQDSLVRDEANLLDGASGAIPLMQACSTTSREHKRLEEQLRQAQKMEAIRPARRRRRARFQQSPDGDGGAY